MVDGGSANGGADNAGGEVTGVDMDITKGEGMSGNWDKDAMNSKNKGDGGDVDGGRGDNSGRRNNYRKPSPYATK